MINIRFHIVSIVAVFLALAIGILTGTTLLDRATIDVLEARQRSLDERNDSLRDENAELQAGIQLEASFSEELETRAVPTLVSGDLDDDTVLLIAARGIDEPAVRAIETQLDAAGATSRGVLWFDEDLDLNDDEQMAALGEQLEITGDPSAVASKLVARIADEITAGISAPETDTTTSDPAGSGTEAGTSDATVDDASGESSDTADDGAGGDDTTTGDSSSAAADDTTTDADDDADEFVAADRHVIDDLIASDRLEWDAPNEDLASPLTGNADNLRVVLVSGEGARLDNGDFANELARSLITRSRGVMIGEIHRPRDPVDEFISNNPPNRGDFVDFIRDSASMSARSITFDHLDTEEGRLALLLALVGVATDDNGSYGSAETANARYPDGPR